MGLETGTFVNDLTPSWPLASDQKRQGDDHLRLIKSVLKTTFPNASKAFYFPTVEQTNTTIVLDGTDMGNCVELDTSVGNVQVNLPSSLGAADRGWWCEVIKTSTDANAGIVFPSAGTIQSNVGYTATIRVGVVCDPAIFKWTGSRWLCFKPGVLIGETKEYDGAVLPPGYLWSDSAAFSPAAFAELAAVFTWGTTRDKRGCVSAGRDNMGIGNASRLDSIGGTVMALIGGNQSHLLTSAQLPSVVIGVSLSGGSTGTPNISMIHNHGYTRATNINQGAMFGADFPAWTGQTTLSTGDFDLNHFHGGVSISGTTNALGSNQVHNNVQPTVIVNKIIRAC